MTFNLLCRQFGTLLLSATAALALPAAAQDRFPSRPLTLTTPDSPGGTQDILARIVAEGLARQTGQTVVVMNRIGANGMIAVNALKAAPADGYNMMIHTNGMVIEQVIKKTDFDIRKDLIPVARVAEAPFGLYTSMFLPVNNVRELVDYIRKNPGKVNYASSGVGSASQFATLGFVIPTGLQVVHVPYAAGGSAVIQAMMAGDVGLFSVGMGFMTPFVADRKVKMMATLGQQRTPLYPDIPAMPDSGVPEVRDYGAAAFYGMYVRAGAAVDRVEYLNQAINRTLAEPAMRDRLISMGFASSASNVGGQNVAMLRQQINEKLAQFQKLVQDARIEVKD